MAGQPTNRGCITGRPSRFLCSPKCPDSAPLNGYRRCTSRVSSSRGARLTTQLRLKLGLRKNGAILPLPYTPLWPLKGNICPFDISHQKQLRKFSEMLYPPSTLHSGGHHRFSTVPDLRGGQVQLLSGTSTLGNVQR